MKKNILLLFFLFSFFLLHAQNSVILRIDEISSDGLELSPYWQYHPGDDVTWADPIFDDSNWDTLNSAELDATNFKGIGWFRIHLQFDSSVAKIPLSIGILQAGASEIYLDGEKLMTFGKVGKTENEEERYYPNLTPIALNVIPEKEHVLAIRYSNHKTGNNKNIEYGKAFLIFLLPANEHIASVLEEKTAINVTSSIFLFGFIVALGIAHLFIFLFYTANKNNLFYFFFASLLSLYALVPFIQTNITDAFVYDRFDNLFIDLFPILLMSLLILVYSIFYKRFPKIVWCILPLGLITFLFVYFQWSFADNVLYFFILISIVEVIRVVIISLVNKKQGAVIISIGVVVFIFFVVVLTLLLVFPNDGNFSGYYASVSFVFTIVSIPVSMSLYLAKQFATTNKDLKKRLIEVQQLSKKTLEQEKEKQKILETQKETLAIQVEERTLEIVEQKKVIEQKNQDITESIDYAKTIQEAILPPRDLIHRFFPNSFILFKPKDIVSGDFYWFAEKDGQKIIACCDCTGHGVPGALMSLVGNNILNQIVNEQGITSPNEILKYLHPSIHKTLNQGEQIETKDGMDISIIVFEKEGRITFSGAHRPLWIIKENELQEIKGNMYSIGGIESETERNFTKHQVKISSNDTIYLFSDGFGDQFNEKDEKLMTRRFKDLLLDIKDKSMTEQHLFLDTFIDKWRGSQEQTDDILVIGIRL